MHFLIWLGAWSIFLGLNNAGRKTLGITDSGWRWFIGLSCFQAASIAMASAVYFLR